MTIICPSCILSHFIENLVVKSFKGMCFFCCVVILIKSNCDNIFTKQYVYLVLAIDLRALSYLRYFILAELLILDSFMFCLSLIVLY